MGAVVVNPGLNNPLNKLGKAIDFNSRRTIRNKSSRTILDVGKSHFIDIRDMHGPILVSCYREGKF